MGVFLDARTSQNASTYGQISVPILAGQNSLFGIVGLDVTQGTVGQIRVQFEGTMAVQLPLLPLLTSVDITIVRGTQQSGLVTVYTARQVLDLSIVGPQLITFTGADFNPGIPASGPLVYSSYVSATAIGTVRVGPESFTALASSG
ncbi:hypothetical protein [Rossellomorea marisflavi]|uniref:hypothetical protein n=1 Tax=Rossellomorea marisflavi TaxID=189381 RepID=UPI00064FDD19|nr:hypothetical protein [Rossellomorea marisflavi]KML00555.1 hypothetical protein VL06_20765 [Rossellomorea marisflavi]